MKNARSLGQWLLPGGLTLLLDRVVKWEYGFQSAVRLDLPWGEGNLFAWIASHFSAAFAIPETQVTQNTGMAFGWLQGHTGLIVAVSVLLLAACVALLRGMRPKGLAVLALSLIAGGALSNLIDRLMYGYVIDMIPFFDWFVFNVADVGVVAGAILCGWSLLFRPQDWKNA